MQRRAGEVGTEQLLAVVYAFEIVEAGERRLVPQDQVSASALSFVEPQLQAVPKRTLVAYGPGLLVYDNYRDARFAAQMVAKVAARVALREVVAGAEPGADAVWTAAGGARFSAVAGGVAEAIKD